MKRNISILGSTGSIGVQTLEIVRRYPTQFKIVALSARNNIELLLAQAKEFKPDFVTIEDEKLYLQNKQLFDGIKVFAGENAQLEAAKAPKSDTVVAAVVGMAGFEGVVTALKHKKQVLLANKESLVAGGRIVMDLAKKNKTEILPLDSEHSAIWQLVQNQKKSNIKKLILTASGGAFYDYKKDDFKNITVEKATKNPNWSMGQKISVDSSTMMNKALEIIEAHHLFDSLNIDYVIHPQSIIHSIIEFVDGTSFAQMSTPSMEYPIAYALFYPERRVPATPPIFAFDKNLSFLEKREDVFFFPALAKKALETHEGAPLVFNAANEVAVELFLNKSIGFGHILNIVQAVVEKGDFPTLKTPADVRLAHEDTCKRVKQDYKQYL
ncbi:MAG: 1-deoxy-D-xylulose-5-phosphate reductoisomerase [Firmicutes bacterium]|nr:1-deoxy-D-xylulose-5-phosphate reductoisomerase [Bacillota bacterium]